MANTSLPNLTERTATANSDLIHVNSGGTDYKETKANFLSDVNSSINSLNNSLAKSLITTATKHASIDEVYRINISVVAKIVVGSFAFHTNAVIAAGSNIFNISSLPNGFDGTYDFFMQTGGSIYMGNTVEGYKYIRANSSIPSGATVFGMFVAGLY